MKVENTYLAKLYRADKGFFLVVLLLILGTLWSVRWSREEFPFLLFGMYSLKEEPRDTFVIYSTSHPARGILPFITDTRRELVSTSVTHVASLYYDGKVAPVQQQMFGKWLYELYSDVTITLPVGEVVIFQKTCTYKADGSINVLDIKQVFAYEPE